MSQRKWELLSLVTTLNNWLNERESYIQNLFTKFYLTCIIIHTTNVFVIMTNMVLSLWKSVSIIKIGVLLFRHSVMFNFLWPQWRTPGFPVLHCLLDLLKFMCIESMMPSNHLIYSCPLLLLPSIFPRIRVLSNESALRIRWPKFRSFSNQHQSFQWIFMVYFL